MCMDLGACFKASWRPYIAVDFLENIRPEDCGLSGLSNWVKDMVHAWLDFCNGQNKWKAIWELGQGEIYPIFGLEVPFTLDCFLVIIWISSMPHYLQSNWLV